MWTRQYRQTRLKHFVLPVLAGLFVLYFGYHSVHGTYGLDAYERHQWQLENLQAELASLKAERASLESRTAQLTDGTIARDMLDEQARSTLGLMRSDELVILWH